MVQKLSPKEIELIQDEYYLVARRHLDVATLARLSDARVSHYLERAKSRRRRRFVFGCTFVSGCAIAAVTTVQSI